MAGKKNVLSSLAVYAEDSEPESDDEAGVETAGSAAGEAREGSWKGRSRCLLGMLLPLQGGRERDGHCGPSIRPRSPEERSGSRTKPSIRRSVVRMDRLFLLIRLLCGNLLKVSVPGSISLGRGMNEGWRESKATEPHYLCSPGLFDERER